MSVALILAHMDDEVFIIPYLLKLSEEKASVNVYYLTKSEGRESRFNQTVREKESIKFLSKLLPSINIKFIGRELGILDLKAHERIPEIINKLLQHIPEDTTKIVTTNFEGGHIDHDTTCFIAQHIANKKSLDLFVFNLYRSKFKKFSFYQVMKLPESNQEAIRIPLKFSEMMTILKIPVTYVSQWRTWIGIYPFLLIKLAIRRAIWLLALNEIDYSKKPNSGAVLYENRRDGTYYEWYEKIINATK